METHRGHVSRVRDAARSRIHMEPISARAIIEDAFRAIEKNMLDAVPWPDVTPQEKYDLCRWQSSIRLINLVQKRLARPHRAVGITKVIRNLNKTWRFALQRKCPFQGLVRPAKHP